MKKRLLLAFLLLIFLPYTVFAIMIMWQTKATPTQSHQHVVVLGAGFNNDTLEPRRQLKQRLDTAYDYAQNHPESTIIVSGGQGDDEIMPEANVMQRYLIAKGLDESRILLEDNSFRTVENLSNTATRYQSKKMLIITSDYHIWRARLLASWLGLEVETLSAPSTLVYLPFNLMREEVALINAYFRDKPKIKPLP